MKKNHKYYKQILSALIDDEVQSKERKNIENHLRECAECSTLVDELRRTKIMIHDNSKVDVTPYFLTRLHAKLDQPQTFFDPVAELAKRWIPVFSVILVILFVSLMFQKNETNLISDDYYLSQRTPAEQRMLIQKKDFSKDEVLMAAMSAERMEK